MRPRNQFFLGWGLLFLSSGLSSFVRQNPDANLADAFALLFGLLASVFGLMFVLASIVNAIRRRKRYAEKWRKR